LSSFIFYYYLLFIGGTLHRYQAKKMYLLNEKKRYSFCRNIQKGWRFSYGFIDFWWTGIIFL